MKTEDYINKYFEDTLSEAELKAFNTLLLNDTDFKEAFEFQKELRDTLILNDREQIKKEIQNWDTGSSKRSFKPWLIAASIIALLAIPSFWYFGQPDLSNDHLFVTNFEPYRNVVHPIVRGENSDDIKAKAFIAYEAKNYKEALNSFNVLLSEGDDATISFYKANVLLQLNKTDEAISILSGNYNIPEIIKAQQLWYLALAYIKTDANKKAKVTLKVLIDNGNYKKKEAEQLLKQLN